MEQCIAVHFSPFIHHNLWRWFPFNDTAIHVIHQSFSWEKVANLCHLIRGWNTLLYCSPIFWVKLMRHLKKEKKTCIMQLEYPCCFWAEVLTLHLQVFLCLEVLDCRVVYDANHRYTIILLTNGECQPARYCVHLVVGQLNFGLAYGRHQRQADLHTAIQVHFGILLK